MSDVLCLYYSRSGKTKKAMLEVAEALDAELVEIHDAVERSGFKGWLRCGMDAMKKTTQPLSHFETEKRRAELVVDVQSDIIDAYNESVLGSVREILCEGFDPQAQMFYGRSYAESPDIDGRVWFTAEEEVPAGTFVSVRLTGTMDGELTGETV